MDQRIRLRPSSALTRPVVGLLAALAVTGAAVPAAWAENGDARGILKAMAAYVSRQENLSLKYDADVEVVTPTVEKIQFSASGDVTMHGPPKLLFAVESGPRE